VLVLPPPVFPAPGAVELLVFLIDEGLVGSTGFEVNAASVTPVSPVRPAPGHVLLAAKADAATTARSRDHHDAGSVNEHCECAIED
jgi:hypothetical protein